MSYITEVNNSSEAQMQSAAEIMKQVFDDLRQNRPKRFQDNDLTSLKLHRRYKSLPDMPISASEDVQIDLQSSTALMMQVFSDLRENRQIAVDVSSVKISKAQRLCKSMPDMAFLTNAEVDAPDAMPSTEITVSLDSLYAETTNSAVMTPVAAELIDIDTMLSVSTTFPLVKPVESDPQRFSPILKVAPQSIGDAESKNGLTKPLDLETASLQEIVSLCGRGDAAEMETTVTAARPKRRSLWSRVKRFARRMVCCGANSDIHH